MIEIHPLSLARKPDFLAFFDGEAFSDNKRWSSCYCQCFYEDHRTIVWSQRNAAENRDAAVRRIGQGHMQGLLAYQDAKVVGWCNAAARTHLHALDCEPQADASQVGTILCFLVSPRHRCQGVAAKLLSAACHYLATLGLKRVEANPRTDATGTAENHFGPLSMYLKAGFAITRTDDDGSVWVSKAL
jgi:GNAT superfamily N-acetyltransferase